MTWANAFLAALKPHTLYAFRGDTPNYPKASGADCPTARAMRQTPLPDVTQLLAKRAVTQCNRDREAVAAYLKTHAILAKRSCSNA